MGSLWSVAGTRGYAGIGHYPIVPVIGRRDGILRQYDRNFTASNCFQSALGFNICQETGSFSATNLSNGTNHLQNAVTSRRSGVLGQHQRSGMPVRRLSFAGRKWRCGHGPSESFSILGTTQTGTGSTQNLPSLMLLGSITIAAVGVLAQTFLTKLLGCAGSLRVVRGQEN